MPKDAPNPADAKKFVAFLAEPDNMGFFTDTFPARKSAMEPAPLQGSDPDGVQGDAALRPPTAARTRTGSRSRRPISTACSQIMTRRRHAAGGDGPGRRARSQALLDAVGPSRRSAPGPRRDSLRGRARSVKTAERRAAVRHHHGHSLRAAGAHRARHPDRLSDRLYGRAERHRRRPAHFVGLKNFQIAWPTRGRRSTAVWNTAYYVLGSIVFQIILGTLVGILLNQKFRGRGFVRSLALIPWVVPGIVAATTWAWMFHTEFGIINYMLTSRRTSSTSRSAGSPTATRSCRR